MSSSESRSAVVLELAEEFLERYRQGQRPSLKEYIDRHPDLAAEIKEMFPAMALMENVALADESLAGADTGPTTPLENAPPQQLGDYRILREVGRGGMGIVYEAEQVSLGRHVALKVLPRKMFVDEAQRRRFEREARAAARLHHTNIVPVFGVGEHEGMPYYVMQFIQGLGLDDVLSELKRMQGSGTATVPGGELRVSRKEAAAVARSLVTGDFPNGEPGASATGESFPPVADAPRSPDSSGTSKLSDSFTLSSAVKLPGSGNDPGSKGKRASYWQSVAQIGVQVAQALEYAHRQGIQHRDIKPSNLLLDTRGTVWVTDFGLARAENEDHLTQTGDIVGTLRYMPPEAFEGRSDKRSDIYSLGLTLYELLALQPAFPEKDRHRLIKRVTTEEPARLNKLSRQVPRDLVTIIHKAIDREPSRRYATAAELAADLQRFLDDEPIQARRISNTERLLRWCRHHPGVATLTGILVLLLVGVTVASLWAATYFSQLAAKESVARREADQAKDAEAAQRIEAEKAKEKEEAAKLQAEKNFSHALKAVDKSFTMVSESQLLQVPGMQPLRRDLLQSALTFYQNFVNERGDDPALRGELAAAYLRVGKIRSELGKGAEARKAYEQAQAVYEALSKEAPESVEWRHGLAQCYHWLGHHDEAIALWQQLVQPGRPAFQKELAEAYNDRANKYDNDSKYAEALQTHQKALAIREMLVRLCPDDPDAQRDLGGSLNNIGVLLSRKNQLADALVMYRRAVEHTEIAFAQAPQNLRTGRFLTIGQSNIALIERQFGHEKEALAAFRRAVEVWQRMARDNPAVPSLHSGLFLAYRTLAHYQRELKQTEEAERTMRRAQEVIDRLPRDGPGDLYNQACYRALCSAFLAHGKGQATAEEQAEQKRELDLAMEALRQAIAAGYRDLERLRHDGSLNALRGREEFKALEADLAARLAAAPADKLKANQQALTQRQKAAQADPHNKRLQADLAASHHASALIQLELGNVTEAQKHLQQAVTLREGLVKDEPNNAQYQTDLGLSRVALGDFYWQSGRLIEAAQACQQNLDVLETAARSGQKGSFVSDQLLAMRRRIAQQYARAGLWAEAAAHYERLLSLNGTTRTDYYHSACLARRAGAPAAYRRICEAMVKRFGAAEDIHQCLDLAWACGLADTAGTEPSQLLTWARKREGPNSVEGNPWWDHVLGLAHYRAGQFAEALSWANTANVADEVWTGHIMNWPVLAMAHHRLGHAEEARRWLEQSTAKWRQLSPLLHALGGRSVLSSTPDYWQNWWIDWVTFEVLFREASVLITGVAPVEAAYDHTHQSLLYSQLGDRDKAEVQWQAAMKIAPKEPALWLARGHVFAEQGQRDKADAAFAQAATLTPEELDRFIQAGWWVVGPYPEDLKLSCPPEKDADPSRPIAAVGRAEQLRWRPAPTEPNGGVDLQPLLKAEHISAYALTYVYAPDERTATLMVGGDDLVRVWVNGRLVHETTGRTEYAWDLDRVPVTLKAGRNAFLCKISQDKGPHFLFLRIADNSLDRAYLHAQLGLWEEAAADFARSLDRQPATESQPYRVGVQAQLLVGDSAGYRRYLDRMFARYDKEDFTAFETAYAGVLGDAGDRATRLVELAEHALQSWRRPWLCLVAGLAHYRAGHWGKAIALLEESLKDSQWRVNAGHPSELGIALAHHRLGHAEEARQWLAKAEAWYDKAVQDALDSPDGTANVGAWLEWPAFVVLRREAHQLILKQDLPDDPRLKKLVERTRDWLKKRDRATAEYDVAILLSGNEPRLRLARAQRLAELKRDKEAEADFAKAVQLKPDDPEVWNARGRFYSEIGQKEKAAADLQKAQTLIAKYRAEPKK